jgi:hypothetical protein
MLRNNGPNVNKKVVLLLNKEIQYERQADLSYKGTCNIHINHDAFPKRLEVLGQIIIDLVLCVYYFFSIWLSKVEG